jgi:hypothetical protein
MVMDLIGLVEVYSPKRICFHHLPQNQVQKLGLHHHCHQSCNDLDTFISLYPHFADSS